MKKYFVAVRLRLKFCDEIPCATCDYVLLKEYPIQNGKIHRPDVFVWDHESDDRRWVAGSLKQYMQWWLDGTLTL